MAETGGLTYTDVSAIGVSDTGLSQYRTPDPLPLPIPARDAPYQPRPLTELYLPSYLSVFDSSYDLLPGEREFGWFGASRYNYRPSDQWYYEGSGALTTLAQVQARNAEVVAAYLVDQRPELVQDMVDRGAVSRETVEQGIALAPNLAARKQNVLQWARFRKLQADAEDAAGFAGSTFGNFLIGSLSMTVSILFPPAAPLVAAGYGAYVLATTIPRQVETGQVKVGEVVNQALAATAIVGGVSSGVSALSSGSTVSPSGTVPTGRFLTPAPRGGNLSFASAIGQPVAGESALTASLFHLPQAPAFTQATGLGLTPINLLQSNPSILSRVGSFITQNPGKVVSVGQTTSQVVDNVLDGDWRGLANTVLSASGIPLTIRQEMPTPPTIQPAALRLVGNSGGGGGSMLFSSPADPASTNVWPWVIGAMMLGLLLFVTKRG